MTVVDTPTPAAAQLLAVRGALEAGQHLAHRDTVKMLWSAYNGLNEATPGTYQEALSYWAYVMVRLHPPRGIHEAMSAISLPDVWDAVSQQEVPA
jgi:hypothetical protein